MVNEPSRQESNFRLLTKSTLCDERGLLVCSRVLGGKVLQGDLGEATDRTGNFGCLCSREREHQPLCPWPQICKRASVCSRSASFPVGYFQWPPQEMSENLRKRHAALQNRENKPPATTSHLLHSLSTLPLLTLSLHFSSSSSAGQ